jgi:hypothetical protein
LSFWTTFHFFRPAPLPSITGKDLAAFLQAVRALNVMHDRGLCTAQVIFGKLPTDDLEPLHSIESLDGDFGMVSFLRSTSQPLDLDWSSTTTGWSDLLQQLDRDDSVYRAQIGLGDANADFVNAVHQPAPENSQTVCPCQWSLNLDLIDLCSLTHDEPQTVSLMSISLGGQGYCFPRTVEQVLKAVRSRPETQLIEDLVRKTWPVTPAHPSPEFIQMRRELAALAPCDDFKAPIDWCWGVNENG